MNEFDINRISESVLAPVLSEVLDLSLKNANHINNNYPGIDLADFDAGVAIQVTSDASSRKIRDTIETFNRHELYRNFNRLIVYVITEKQGSYSGTGFGALTDGQIGFDKDRDILDYRDVLKRVDKFDVQRTKRVLDLLKANLEGWHLPITSAEPEKKESFIMNLIEVTLPSTLFVGRLAVNREAVMERDRELKGRLRYDATTRDVAKAALAHMGQRFGTDWEVHGGQVITFHDLRDRIPLRNIVEPGTVELISPKEFYDIGDYQVDEGRFGLFQSLLRRCLQQKLFKDGINWQDKERLFFFIEEDSEPVRTETWGNKKRSTRKVFERVMNKKDPNKVLRQVHHAFRVRFFEIGNQWYMMVMPERFVSLDGYRKSKYAHETTSYYKKTERNEHVLNNLQFIAYILRHGAGATLFRARSNYNILKFGNLVRLEDAPFLDDDDWLPDEDEKTRATIENEYADGNILTLDL